MKKILIVTHHNTHHIGGVETYNKNLVDIFTKHGIFVYEINVYADRKYLEFNDKSNYEFVYTEYFDKLKLHNIFVNKQSPNPFLKFWTFVKMYLCEVKNSRFIKKFVQRNNVDLVINNNFSTPFWFNKGTEYVWVQHFDERIYRISLFQKILRKCLCVKDVFKFKNLVFFTEEDCEKLKRHRRIKKASNCFAIAPSVLQNFKIDRSDFASINQIAYIGRLTDEQKNISFLNEITAYANSVNRPITIDVYGDGEDADLLKENEHIVLHGYLSHDQMQKRLANVKLLLLPSKYEGFPMAIVEAMSLGIPCITANTYSNAKYLVNADRGALIEGHDAKIWFNEISRIMNLDERAYRECCKKCEMFADSKLKFEIFERKWLDLVKNLIF